MRTTEKELIRLLRHFMRDGPAYSRKGKVKYCSNCEYPSEFGKKNHLRGCKTDEAEKLIVKLKENVRGRF